MIFVAVSRSSTHQLGKANERSIRLVENLGVEGDAHAGVTVKHRSRVRRDPTQPNLRQVHLLHDELFEELRAKGFVVSPGQLGENVTTRGVELLELPTGTRLHLGEHAIVEITGLRNPCTQLDGLQSGLMKAALETRADGALVRKSGVMGVVRVGGEVQRGDSIRIELPALPHLPLQPV